MSAKQVRTKRTSRWPKRFRWSSSRFSPERIASIVAMFLASMVMAIGFHRDVRLMEVFFRASVVFAVIWVIVFLACFAVQQIVRKEMARRKREAAAAAVEDETASDDSYEQIGEV